MSRKPLPHRHLGHGQNRDLQQGQDRDRPRFWDFKLRRLAVFRQLIIASLKGFFVNLYLRTRRAWAAIFEFSQPDRWRRTSIKRNISTGEPITSHNCIDCRFWSELSQRTRNAGQFEAICLTTRSPFYLMWRTEADGCPAWAEGGAGAIDSPDLPPGFYHLR